MHEVRRLDTRQAAAYLGPHISHRTLEDYRVRGGGPIYCRLGRHVIYQTDDLDAWLASKRRQSTTVPAPLEAVAA